jgi:hypothetical protein
VRLPVLKLEAPTAILPLVLSELVNDARNAACPIRALSTYRKFSHVSVLLHAKFTLDAASDEPRILTDRSGNTRQVNGNPIQCKGFGIKLGHRGPCQLFFFGLSKLGVPTGMNIGHLAVIDSNKTLCPTTNIFK